jgi:hypothetical protein
MPHGSCRYLPRGRPFTVPGNERTDRRPVLRRGGLRAHSPSAFASIYAAEATLPTAHWSQRAADTAGGHDSAIFLALVDDEVVGVVGTFRTALDSAVERLVDRHDATRIWRPVAFSARESPGVLATATALVDLELTPTAVPPNPPLALDLDIEIATATLGHQRLRQLPMRVIGVGGDTLAAPSMDANGRCADRGRSPGLSPALNRL